MNLDQPTSLAQQEGELFRLLAENVIDYAIFVMDSQGLVQSWNHAAERLLGYQHHEIIGRNYDIFFTAEDIEADVPRKEMEEALAGGRGDDDRWHIRKDGSRFWSGGTMTPLWEGDTLRGFAKIMRDRTEWKQAEDERAEAERKKRLYEAALSNTPDLVYVFDLDHRFTYANQILLRMWGKTWDEAIGKNCLELGYEPWHAAMHDQEIDQVVATKQPIKGEVPFTGTFGRRIYEYILVPVLDENGEVEAVAGTTRDVTDRRQAEEDMRHSEERFRSLMEQAPFSIQIFSPDGRTSRVNRAWEELWGVRCEQIEGYNVLEDRQLEAKGVLHLIRQGFAGQATRIPAIEYNPNETIPNIARHEDPRRWLSAVIYPIKDGAGTVREVILVHEDITAYKRAEEKLQNSQHQSHMILERISDAFFGLDRDWRFNYVNHQAEVLLGRTREDLVGKKVWDEYVPAVGTEFDRSYHQAMAENVTVTFEAFYPPHNRWYEVHAYPSPDGLSVYFREVSERKQAEIALQESEQRFRQLADAMPQIVWTAQPDGNIDYLNRRWTEFTSLPQSVGNDAWGQLLHPDDAPTAHERWTHSVTTGVPFEMEIRLLDRAEQVYRWHLIRTVAVQNESGNVARWFGTATDIHEQKRAEESARFLAEASAALAGVVDYQSTLQHIATLAVPYFADWSAVDIQDGNGSLIRLAVAHQDPCKVALVHEIMRDYPPDPQSPSGALAVYRTGQPQIVNEISDSMLVQGARDERHLHMIRSLGLKSYICVPLVVSGKPLGALTFATAESKRRYLAADLSLATDLANRAAVAVENTQLYQSLRDADRRKDEFLATLAHELRNPLAPICNALQLLKIPRVDAETVERSKEVMERQVHHLVRLVDDLMDVSRVMRGKIELRRENIELAIVVARAVETIQPLVDAQCHELIVSLPTESLPVDADPIRLAQVVGNVLTNATKYTERGGRIWLTASRDGETAVLRIRDTGIGIAADMLHRIFELFVQVDHASTKAQGGLGIGLTLVKNLVEMHNGRVEVHSEGLGRGSEFVLRLPLSPLNNGAKVPDEIKPKASPPQPSGYRLLVVDDNQDAANSLSLLLRFQGHEVRVAYSGMAALETAKMYSPDVVFLDIGMPGMDGYEVAHRLRQMPGLEATVLAALTGWGQPADRRRTSEAGFNHHLVKPPEPKALEAVLSGLRKRP